MPSLLQQLGSNEAILLMYLADELTGEDRAEVERMLESDEALRSQFDELSALNEHVMERLDSLDVCSRAADENGIQRLLRAMRRHQHELAVRQTHMRRAEPGRPWPKWVYAAASVAAVVFLLLGLWGVGVLNLPGEGRVQDENGPLQMAENPPAAVLDGELQRSFAVLSSPTPLDDVDRQLSAAQSTGSEEDELKLPAL